MPVAKCYNLNRNRITVPRVKLAFLDSHHNPFLYGSVALDKLLHLSATALLLGNIPTSLSCSECLCLGSLAHISAPGWQGQGLRLLCDPQGSELNAQSGLGNTVFVE